MMKMYFIQGAAGEKFSWFFFQLAVEYDQDIRTLWKVLKSLTDMKKNQFSISS